ncbi:MAG TPA: hypothetical protein VFQ65_30800 [Kofleriaceae bacterium]|nr:hypothetical protein [Kofleriaceae bacterium]
MLAGVAVVVLAGIGYVIYRLATEDRVSPACEHLEALGDPLAVEVVVQFVQDYVVGLGVEGEKHVRVTSEGTHARCIEAFEDLEHAMGNAQFERKLKCTVDAKTSVEARACFNTTMRRTTQ